MTTVDTPQIMDDNLVTRRKKILQSIEDIRVKKSEIAQALRELKETYPQPDENVKNDIRQLVDAFDAISTQEKQYMDILATIVEIHQQATLDIAKDFEKKIEEDEKSQADKKDKTPEEIASNEVMAEIQEALLELKKVSEAAVAASELNDKLVERLQLQKKKKSAMMEVRAKKAKELDEEANRVRAEVMERINKMAALKKTTGRQEKELKDLQKQCLQLGIQLGYNDGHEIDLEAAHAVLDQNQRVPLIGETQEKPELNDQEKEVRRQEIRENIKKEMEKKEQVNTLIREKLAAMDARRKRLQEIRKMLEKNETKKVEIAAQTGEGIPLAPETPRPSEESYAPIVAPEDIEQEEEEDGPIVEKSIDDILENAKANLNNLTAMRERLEQIRETGGADLNEADVQLLEQLEHVNLDVEEEPIVEKPAAPKTSSNDIESAVQESFHAVFEQARLSLAKNQAELANSSPESCVKEIIERIEETLPTAPSTASSFSVSLSLLSLKGGELRELAGHLLRLAELCDE